MKLRITVERERSPIATLPDLVKAIEVELVETATRSAAEALLRAIKAEYTLHCLSFDNEILEAAQALAVALGLSEPE